MPSVQQQYSALSHEDTDFNCEDALDTNKPSSRHRSRLLKVVTNPFLSSAWMLANLIVTVALFHHVFFARATPYHTGLNGLLKQSSYYSPILDRLEIPLSTTRMNGSFFAPPHSSIWRGDPSPAVDEAWDRASAFAYHTIRGADVLALGKDPGKTVKAPVSWGLGPDAHIVQIDVFHQIHCLNSLRKAAFHEHYHPPTGALQVQHLKHCLHMLVQNLMCSANVDLITHNWIETQRHPFPDFSINHQCRDFEAVRAWSEEHKVETKEMVEAMEVPADAEVLSIDLRLLELLREHKDMDH